MGALTLGAIWGLHYSQNKNPNQKKKVRFQEGFTSDVVQDFLRTKGLSEALFEDSTSENPMQNVLMTDYDRASDKRPAPAAYTEEAQAKVLENTKAMIDSINPEQPKISNKLFRSLEDLLSM